MTAIAIDIQHKRYRGTTHAAAIENFQLRVEANEFVCLVGQSGCGKTTLLNLVAGLDSDYQGRIEFEQTAAAKVGYVFQQPRLLPWRTARQNVELAFSDAIDHALIDSLFAEMQLADKQQIFPNQLSLGMSRRVAIIRAFAINPDVLLMDEPFVSLDPPTARQVRQLLRRLWLSRPHTVLFVTHDLREAIALADRLIFLTATPMQPLQDVAVTIPADERDNEAAIEAFREQLLTQYPAIQALL